MRTRSLFPLALALLASGCLRGSLGYYASSPVAASGLLVTDDRLRRAMESGSFEMALTGITKNKEAEYAPPDRLLRKMYQGLVAYYAGRYDESGAALQSAADIAEDRFTKSVSKGAMSLLTSDLVLPYSPGSSERLLTHYYAMQTYVKKDDLRGAAVEARRMSELLQRYSEKMDKSERPTRAALHYLAGAVFEAAGEHNDADVSYRNAAALLAIDAVAVRPHSTVTDSVRSDSSAARRRLAAASKKSKPRATKSATPPVLAAALTTLPNVPRVAPPGDTVPTGEVIVVIEGGFVTHPVEQSLYLDLDDDEAKVFGDDDDADEVHVESIVSRVMADLSSGPNDVGYCDWPSSCHTAEMRRRNRDDGYGIKVSWPVFVRPGTPVTAAFVRADSMPTAPVLMVASVSDAIVADYRRRRVQVLARTIARAMMKHGITKEAEKKHGAFGEFLASVGANVTERADTRSWHLLPGHITIARMRLTAGRHRISVDLPGRDSSGVARRLELGEVEVIAGKISFVSTRVWRADGSLPSVVSGRRAGAGVL